MPGFLCRNRNKSAQSQHVSFLMGRVSDLEKRAHGRVQIEEHAVDPLCDFIAVVAKIHPLGQSSQAAKDLLVIAQAVREKAGRSYDSAEARLINEVFGRYADYRNKEVSYENLFELAEWIVDGAVRMGDGDY